MTTFKSNRRYPTPVTVTDDPRSHTLALQQMIEALNIGQRRTKDVNNSFVRVQELVDVGLIEMAGDQLKATNTAGATTLDGLTDVDTTGVADGFTLVYDAATSTWHVAAAGGGATTLDGLSDVNTAGVANGYTLVYDAGTSTWLVGPPGGGSTSPLTTKGDLWGFTTVDARVGIGADGTLLQADSTQAAGLAWSAILTGAYHFSNANMTVDSYIDNRLGYISTSYMEVYAGAAEAGTWLYSSSPAADNRWLGIRQTTAGVGTITLSDDAGTTYRNVMEWTRSGAAVATIKYGNSTNNPTHTFYGAVTINGNLTLGTDNFITLDLHSSSAATPAAGNLAIYAKADKKLYIKDDAGLETNLAHPPVATDTIWDAKGDLAAGTGADAASKLSVGTDGQILSADSTQSTGLKWVTLVASPNGAQISRTGAAQSLTSGSVTAIQFDTEDRDNNNYANLGTNNTRLTVPTAGWYVICGVVQFNAAANGIRDIGIRVNGSGNRYGFQRQPGSASLNQTLATSTILYLAANDYVELMAAQDSGGSVNSNVTAGQWPLLSIHSLAGGSTASGYPKQLGYAGI